MKKKDAAATRQLDSLGRIVLPKSIRENTRIEIGTAMEFFIKGNTIILQPYRPGCKMCSTIDVPLYGKASLCMTCIEELHNEVTQRKVDED